MLSTLDWACGQIASGADGALWSANSLQNTIVRSTTTGVASAFHNPTIANPQSAVAAPDGNIWFTNRGNNSIGRITPAGNVNQYSDPSINAPEGMALGSDGRLWFANNGNDSIGAISMGGVVSHFSAPSVHGPHGVAAGANGFVWFTNPVSGSIGRIATASGAITTFTSAAIGTPRGITRGADGNMWFTDDTNQAVGRLTNAGVVTEFPGGSAIGDVIASGSDGNLWFGTGFSGVTAMDTSGAVVAEFVSTIDEAPSGIAIGPDGAMWYTSYSSGTIGRIATPASQRLVAVAWSPTEAMRLQQIAAYLGNSPGQAQKAAVYLLGFLIGFLPPAPDPQVIPVAGSSVAFTSAWDPNEVSIIDSVNAEFSLTDEESTRFSVNLLSFLLGLQGH